MKISFSSVILSALAASVVTAHGHSAHHAKRSMAAVYPECTETHPSASSLAAVFSSRCEAYDYCTHECQKPDEICLNWKYSWNNDQWINCSDESPSSELLQAEFCSEEEVLNICSKECLNSDEVCQTWVNNYLGEEDHVLTVYPECSETNPSPSVLEGAFSSACEAYEYCIGECQNSETICVLNWKYAYPSDFPDCTDENPDSSLLTGGFCSRDEAHDFCIHECHNSDEVCQTWKSNHGGDERVLMTISEDLDALEPSEDSKRRTLFCIGRLCI